MKRAYGGESPTPGQLFLGNWGFCEKKNIFWTKKNDDFFFKFFGKNVFIPKVSRGLNLVFRVREHHLERFSEVLVPSSFFFVQKYVFF